MKRSLIFLALLCLAPATLAQEPAPSSSPTASPTTSPTTSPTASPPQSPTASPSPEPVRLQTVVADKNLRLILTRIAPECQILRVALLRKDALMPGYGAFNRAVRVDQTLGRVVTLVLGPEFHPHRYGAGEIRLSCYDASGKTLSNLSNKAPLALDQNELMVDIGSAFGPGAADENQP